MSSYLTNLFGRSPVRPLQEHMTKVHACVNLLTPLFDALIANDQEKIKEVRQDISVLESEADTLKWELRNHLPTGLFMPVDRRDLLEVLQMQDKIANQAQDIAGLIIGRRMTLPEKMHETFHTYGKRCVDATTQALKVINELDELVETGFRGAEVERVQDMINELNAIENDTDKLQIKLRDMLFEIEDTLRPTDVMFTYRLLESVGNVADLSQRVGSRLQLLLAR
ncbi:MAG: TIGR00153 family protein [Gammaproteobacteria bacterium]|nr:TIGR00153 family protein [Gammaproteobacteria bacterium]